MKMKRKAVFTVLIAMILLVTAVIFVIFSNLNDTDKRKSDFSKLSLIDAFNKLHTRISKEYAFTDWKGIDWNTLYAEYEGKIKDAELTNDFDAYYISLLSYIREIPDGHVGMTSFREIDDKYIGGGFGLAAAKLDDGRVIVTWVDESSKAWKDGICVGMELIEWDGKPINDAIAAVSTIFAGGSATKENTEYKRIQYLVRAPVGTKINISFLNNVNSEPHSVSLTAYDDNKQSLAKSYPNSVVSDKLRDMILEIENSEPIPESIVESKMINGNISYIKIWAEIDADLQLTGKVQSTVQLLRAAVQEAIAKKSVGMIIDIRNNLGGLDAMSAEILGSFYSEKTIYEYLNIYNSATGEREIQPLDPESDTLPVYIEPAQQCYTDWIIALVNAKCISSGEGIAMGIKNLPNGDTLGFLGTNGSFGMCGDEAVMPGGIIVKWPSGQSLDSNKEIQLDSRNGFGGVSPSIRVPMTAESAIKVANGEDVELEEAVRILSEAANKK